ncbi:hypothetical protein J6590_053979 [Homalodisca vitripennis]|nr:hypothetical protein J6590_053979 [Homalodisca vitripennis]
MDLARFNLALPAPSGRNGCGIGQYAVHSAPNSEASSKFLCEIGRLSCHRVTCGGRRTQSPESHRPIDEYSHLPDPPVRHVIRSQEGFYFGFRSGCPTDRGGFWSGSFFGIFSPLPPRPSRLKIVLLQYRYTEGICFI